MGGPSVYHVPTTGYGRGQPGAALLVQMYSSTSGASTDTAATDSAAAVARVLTGLPNQAVPEIGVAMTSNALSLYGANVVPGESLKTSSVATTTATLIGTATAASSGVVTMVVAKSSSDGSGVSDWTTGEGVKSATYEITRGTYEATECSSRGTCDPDSGTCECAPGYTGISCATQTIIM